MRIDNTGGDDTVKMDTNRSGSEDNLRVVSIFDLQLITEPVPTEMVSDEEVILSFVESVMPGGFVTRYLRLANLGVRIGDTVSD